MRNAQESCRKQSSGLFEYFLTSNLSSCETEDLVVVEKKLISSLLNTDVHNCSSTSNEKKMVNQLCFRIKYQI